MAARAWPALWPRRSAPQFPRPWAECGWALLGAVGVVVVGQWYNQGWLIPHGGPLEPILDAGNQILIFAPLLAVPVLRRQTWGSVLIVRERLWARLFVGVGLALLAILVFTSVRANGGDWLAVAGRTYAYHNVGLAVQVLLEDIAIAILLVRLAAAVPVALAVLLVASLFAAGHIPTMLAQGASLAELESLALDFGFGVGVAGFLWRSADVAWLWCVHFAMDMMQYYGTG